jgi:single-stranded-DNA-specific exonuclease
VGFAGVLGDLLTSGQSVLVAVADVPRRRAGLEALVAGLAPDRLPVAGWTDLAGRPDLAEPFDHLVALDPPHRRGLAEALPGPHGALAHLAWGPSDAKFARVVGEAELDLGPALREAWLALRDLPEPAGEALRAALQGELRHPHSPAVCARLARVLGELTLVRYEGVADGGPRCALLGAQRTALDSSPAYRAYRARLETMDRALAPELDPAPRPKSEPVEPPAAALAA